MIIYASQAFVKRLGCLVSLPDERPQQSQAMNGWSGDLLKIARCGQVMVMMHDASLATLIIPLQGIRRFDAFLPVFLQRLAELFHPFGVPPDPANQSVIVFRRSNRQLIGTLNDAKNLIMHTIMDQMDLGFIIDWNAAQEFINKTPFALIHYNTPMEELAAAIQRS